MVTFETKMNKHLLLLDLIVKEEFRGKGLYDYQKDFYWQLQRNDLNIINKSRQIGISFFYAGSALLWALQGEPQIIVSNSERQSKNVMVYIDLWLNALMKVYPNDLPESNIVERNKTLIRFKDAAPIYALPNSASTIRGISAAKGRVFFDEFAHFLHGSDEQLWTALLPTLSRGDRKRVCINSTPFGESNLYYRMCNDRNQFPDFKYKFYSYKDCPDINIELIKRNMDSLSFAQEYEGAFLGDTNTYYPFSITKSCINTELEYVIDLNSIPYPLYLGGDIGRRRDFTAITVLAATEKGPRLVYKKVLKTQEEKEWKNQYALFRTILSAKNMMRAYIDTGFGQQMIETLQQEFSSVVPFNFTNENKGQMHPSFRKRLENKGIEMPDDMEIINSLHLIERKQSGNSVIYDSDKRTDEHGHADLAVSLVLANWAYERESGSSSKFLTPEIYQGYERRGDFKEASISHFRSVQRKRRF